ncbi:MAG: hypothetical protein KIT24_05050 [Phycisphaeraceae bacterium]|nr:hypothetical protein [Phycisphaeraceae bacterium]
MKEKCNRLVRVLAAPLLAGALLVPCAGVSEAVASTGKTAATAVSKPPVKVSRGKASKRAVKVTAESGRIGNYGVSISLDVDWEDLGREVWKWMKSASRTMFSDHAVLREVKYIEHGGKKWPVVFIPITNDRDGSGKRITGNLALADVFGKGEISYRVFFSASKERLKELRCVMKNDVDWGSDTTWGHGRHVRNGDVIPSWGGARERYLASRGGQWRQGDAVILVRADMPVAAFKMISNLPGVSMHSTTDRK